MFKIEKLNFDQIQYVERCALAPHGEIIQTTFNGNTLVGMRTDYKDPMGGAEAILMVGGNDNGLLVSVDQIGNPPAVVITKLVRLIATNIKPFNPNHNPPVVGNLLQQPDGAVIVRSQAILPGSTTPLPAFVYLTDGKPNSPKGTCVSYLSMVNMRGVSQSCGVELQSEPAKEGL